MQEDEGGFVSDSIYPWIHNVPQNFLVDLRGHHQLLGEEERRHDVALVEHDYKVYGRGGEFGTLCRGDLFHVLTDQAVDLLVALLVLVAVIFIGRNLSIPAD